jgi:hypothetical protein
MEAQTCSIHGRQQMLKNFDWITGGKCNTLERVSKDDSKILKRILKKCDASVRTEFAYLSAELGGWFV